jgi:hypothetical protein
LSNDDGEGNAQFLYEIDKVFHDDEFCQPKLIQSQDFLIYVLGDDDV